MQRIIKAGHAADAGLIFHIFAMDSSSTTGAGKASVAFGSWSCRYIRAGGAISGAITPEDITTIGTYAAPTANTNIRIKAVDNTNMIGVYELQLHLDWVATGSEAVTIFLTATGVAPVVLTIPLVLVNVQDSVRAGLTALPNAAADAAGGLIISDAGGLDADAQRSDVAAILVDTGTTLDGRIPAALVSGRIDASVGAIAANAITAASMNADASAEIADAVWDEDATGHQTGGTFGQAIGDPGADTTTIYQSVVTDAAGTNVAADIIAIKAETAAILTDTGTTLDGKIDTIDTVVDAILVDTGTTLDGRIPAALTAGGNMKCDSLAIDGSTEAADRLQKSAETIVYCTVGAASTTTSIVTSAMSPAAAVIDQFKGRIVIFDRATTTANLRGQATDITASTALGVLTVTALTDAPASGDVFVIV